MKKFSDHRIYFLEGLEDTSQIFLRDTHIEKKLLSYLEYCRRDRLQVRLIVVHLWCEC
jgi:hypothetical protein